MNHHEQTSSGVEADLNRIERVGRGKRDLVLIAAVVVVAILIGAVWFGFRGSHVSQSAAAMTVPAPRVGANVVPRPTKP
jgi:Kef-type K+ transport system membrane component KefB